MNINGRMKVKTLKSQFATEFGLTLRVYDGRSFAADESTLASIRKGDSKGGEFAPRKNTKVGNLEDKIKEMFGIKVQIAGSDDSYLCDNDLTLLGAVDEDAKKVSRKEKKVESTLKENQNFEETDFVDTTSENETKKMTFLAKIKWGECCESIDLEELPTDFLEAKKLWEGKDEKCYEILKKYIKCYFVSDNLMGDITDILDIDDDLESENISIFSVDFDSTCLPKISATASFEIPVEKIFSQAELDEWQEDNDYLDSAVSFEWCFDEIELEDAVLSEHEGLSFHVNDQPKTNIKNDGDSMSKIRVLLNVGVAEMTMVEGSDDLLLEDYDELQNFKFPGTENYNSEEFSQWISKHISVWFDGDLDEPEKFKSIRYVGSSGPESFNDDECLTLANIGLFFDIELNAEIIDEDELEDIFHLAVFVLQVEGITAEFRELSDYSAEVSTEDPKNYCEEVNVWNND